MVAKIKVSRDPVRMRVRVRALISFNNVQAGDEADVEWTPRVDGWIRAGLVKEVTDGASAAGPGSTEPDDHERIPDGASGSGEASREPGKGFGSGAYGSSA